MEKLKMHLTDWVEDMMSIPYRGKEVMVETIGF